jgi:adenylyltransferase/sulfurtransferase
MVATVKPPAPGRNRDRALLFSMAGASLTRVPAPHQHDGRRGGVMARTSEPDLEITVGECQQALNAGRHLVLLDVREPREHAFVKLPGSRLIPLRQLATRLDELEGETDLVAYCHHGSRSLVAAKLLRQAGFSGARSLAGGIAAWSREIDPSLPCY